MSAVPDCAANIPAAEPPPCTSIVTPWCNTIYSSDNTSAKGWTEVEPAKITPELLRMQPVRKIKRKIENIRTKTTLARVKIGRFNGFFILQHSQCLHLFIEYQ
jgi:hypothetical protein